MYDQDSGVSSSCSSIYFPNDVFRLSSNVSPINVKPTPRTLVVDPEKIDHFPFRHAAFAMPVVRLRQVARVCVAQQKRLLLRTWGRLCGHAASLNAAEGTWPVATAATQADRPQAMEKEAASSRTAVAAAESAAAGNRSVNDEARKLGATRLVSGSS